MTASLLSARAAFALGLIAFALEVVLITPWWDEVAEGNAVAHFSQHGLIFLGGVLLGVALRDLFVQSRRAA